MSRPGPSAPAGASPTYTWPGRHFSAASTSAGMRPARFAAGITGYAIVSAYGRFFAECGFAEEVETVNAAWKAGDRAGAVKAISEPMLDGLGAVGSADFCRERLAAFARTGATPGAAARPSLLGTFRAFP